MADTERRIRIRRMVDGHCMRGQIRTGSSGGARGGEREKMEGGPRVPRRTSPALDASIPDPTRPLEPEQIASGEVGDAEY
jgi:hypothetical protein